TETSTLSLHDALPIFAAGKGGAAKPQTEVLSEEDLGSISITFDDLASLDEAAKTQIMSKGPEFSRAAGLARTEVADSRAVPAIRSEEHTSNSSHLGIS